MTEKLETPTAPQVAEAPDRGAGDSPTAPPLIVFGADDELVCVDDTCAPAEAAK